MYVFHTHIHTFTIPYTPHIPITDTYSSHTCAHISQYNGLHLHIALSGAECPPLVFLACHSPIIRPLWLMPFVSHVLGGHQAQRTMYATSVLA